MEHPTTQVDMELSFGETKDDGSEQDSNGYYQNYYIEMKYPDGSPAGTLFIGLLETYGNERSAEWRMDQLSQGGELFRATRWQDLAYDDKDQVITSAKAACNKQAHVKDIPNAEWEPNFIEQVS